MFEETHITQAQYNITNTLFYIGTYITNTLFYREDRKNGKNGADATQDTSLSSGPDTTSCSAFLLAATLL